LLNTVDSVGEAADEIADLVAGTGRPCTDGLAVVETAAGRSVHGLPWAVVLVDGEEAVRVWADRAGHVRVAVRASGRVAARAGATRPIATVAVDGAVVYGDDASPVPGLT
jgi:hypothetical protein